MSLSTKILIWLGVIVTLGALGFIIYNQHQISAKQLAIESQVIAQKQLVDGIVRSQSSWATKDDIDKFTKDNGINLKAIQEDLDKLHSEVSAVNVAVADSYGQHVGNLPSTSTGPSNPKPPAPVTCKDGTPCPNTDPFGYLTKQQNLALNEDFGTLKVPFGSVGFSAWQQSPWSIDIKPRDYHVSTVIGTDENQRMSVYNKFVVEVDGKKYDVPIKTATTEQVYPDAKFSWWNPRAFLGANGSVGVNPVQGEFTPSLSLQIMSYGRYKTQPDFSVLQAGVGYGTVSKRPQVVVTPFAYNIGKHIPFMNNTYIGPVISVGTDGNVFLGGGLSVGL
jgi:hypothetical protein